MVIEKSCHLPSDLIESTVSVKDLCSLGVGRLYDVEETEVWWPLCLVFLFLLKKNKCIQYIP